MAQRAVQQRLDSERERALAQLLTQRALSLQQRTSNEGVTAFLRRPVVRERPNERFLQSTLRNLASSNRRTEEAEMWRAWEERQQRTTGEQDSPSGSGRQEGGDGTGPESGTRPLSRSPQRRSQSHEGDPRVSPARKQHRSEQHGSRSRDAGDGMQQQDRTGRRSRSRSRSLSRHGSKDRSVSPLAERSPPHASHRHSGPGDHGHGAGRQRRGSSLQAEGDSSGGSSRERSDDDRRQRRRVTGGNGQSHGNEQRSGRHSECSDDDGQGEYDDDGRVMMTEEDIAEMLGRHRVRGRGGVGLRFEVGPSLEPGAEDQGGKPRRAGVPCGPKVPKWIKALSKKQDKGKEQGAKGKKDGADAKKKRKKRSKDKSSKAKRRKGEEGGSSKRGKRKREDKSCRRKNVKSRRRSSASSGSASSSPSPSSSTSASSSSGS